jgi:hypothetical protein
VGKRGERDYLGDPCIDGTIVLKWKLKVWAWELNWIELSQDRDSWWALGNAVMKFLVPKIAENFLTSKEPVSFS